MASQPCAAAGLNRQAAAAAASTAAQTVRAAPGAAATGRPAAHARSPKVPNGLYRGCRAGAQPAAAWRDGT